MREPALERIEEERMPSRVAICSTQPLVRPGQPRPARLQFEQRAHELQFGRGKDSALRGGNELPRRVGELRGQRHLAAGPARDERGFGAGRLHPGGELAHADELQRASREDEAIAGREARDEAFLDVAQRLAGLEADRDRRFRHDRADADPVPARDPRVRNARDAVVADHDAAILGIRVETRAAVQDEVQRELPIGVGEFRVRLRPADLGPQLVRLEAAAQRASDQMLDQRVLRCRARACAPRSRVRRRPRGRRPPRRARAPAWAR